MLFEVSKVDRDFQNGLDEFYSENWIHLGTVNADSRREAISKAKMLIRINEPNARPIFSGAFYSHTVEEV